MRIRIKSIFIIGGLICFFGSCKEYQIQTKPNVIIINTDDLGFGDLGCYGATKVHTPNIDKLAQEGMRFTDAHSASAVCTPSRYALITGEYPFRKDGLSSPVFLKSPLIIDTTNVTIADVMKKAGYSTACIGKWHLGFGKTKPTNWNKKLSPGPLELGFDYYFGVPVVNSHPPFVYVENHQVVGLSSDDPFVYGKTASTKIYPEKFDLNQIGGAEAAHVLYQDEEVGTTLKNKAVQWIREQKGKPFMLYFATTNIHHPFTPAPQFNGTSEAGIYGDFIHELDWIVGEVLEVLKEQGIEDNTIVVFTSDNGGMLNQGGQQAWELGHYMNRDLLGFKFDAWEGGHRVPFIVKWPGTIKKASTSNALISNVDIFSTLSTIVGLPEMKKEAKDSYDILPLLKGETEKQVREDLIISPVKQSHIAIRKGKWMYIGAKGGGGFTNPNIGNHALGGPGAFKFTNQVNSDIVDGKIKPNAPKGQLYNLEKDPFQSNNVYDDFPDIVEQMDNRIAELLDSERTAPVK